MSINNIQVLITTMNLTNPVELIEKMNIQGSAMIGNQTNYNSVEKVYYNNICFDIYSFNERGVGLNRNNLLMRSQADYCLFGDDDLVYVDNYEELVLHYFNKYSDADIIIFNLEEETKSRYIIKKDFRVNFFNYMRFGAARIAIKRKSVLLNGIFFNQCFGGGTEHSNGEDTLFLTECLKKGLRIYAVSNTIAKLVETRESTWFKGYNEKYLMDKGLLYNQISKRHYRFLCFQDAIRHSNLYDNKSIIYNYKTMIQGVKKYVK